MAPQKPNVIVNIFLKIAHSKNNQTIVPYTKAFTPAISTLYFLKNHFTLDSQISQGRRY